MRIVVNAVEGVSELVIHAEVYDTSSPIPGDWRLIERQTWATGRHHAFVSDSGVAALGLELAEELLQHLAGQGG